ncbi:glycosyltransferase family 2 protein [Limosilactobacillus vaginalis]|uniref:glycosyltransferase family 2 protein n=1 Tax=Limosilactobacillus vaginalis TaxID=1633 RepID=UPI0025A3D8CB|nr:glycosyltransferase family 2 protein [Limosilactobacillus vaginalis]MDM8303799.1 glycosyltransferase family 2 protein [Limosilactobacillus vaginalis]
MKKVSVIIPVYNKRPFLNQCIKSVVEQNHMNLQIVIVDDGSSDGSIGIINTWLKKDKRITFIQQLHAGVSEARNKGIKIANGDYIIFLDADDELTSDYIECLVDNHKSNQLVICGLIERDFESRKVLNKIELENERISNLQYNKIFNKSNYPIFSIPYCKLFDLSIIRENNILFTNQQFGEDSIFVLNYLAKIREIKLISKCGYINNIVPNTLSRKYVNNIEQQLLNIMKVLVNNFPTIDNNSWNFMLCRSIKLSLTNSFRLGFGSFINECNTLINDNTFKNVKITSNLGVKDKVLVFLLKKRLYFLLFIIFYISKQV